MSESTEVHLAGHIDGMSPLKSAEIEDDVIQREIMCFLADSAMKLWNIPERLLASVQNVVGELWVENFAEPFRERCCTKAALDTEFYRQFKDMNNGQRMGAVLYELGFDDINNFLEKQKPAIAKALLKMGIDVDVAAVA